MHSIPAKSVAKILDLAAQRGVDATLACSEADIDPHAIDEVDRRIPFASVVRLYESCARLSGDASFGLHVGELSHPTMFDLVGYLVIHSPTVGVALRRLERYQRVWTTGSLLTVSVDGGRAQIEYRYDITDPGREGRRQDCEATLAIVAAGLRTLVASTWRPDEVTFEHESPADTSEHARLFRCPTLFGRASNTLIFDAAVLAQPIQHADPALSAILDRHARTLLEAAPADSDFVARVRTVIVPALPGGEPDLMTVARRLHTSTRTLQRRLHSERTSLRQVVDDVRQELARRYLEQPDLTIADVVSLLGYADQGTFYRAFRKWTGLTPGAFRARQVAQE